MNELARQAFETKNFDLSAEILERTVSEDGPSIERFLKLGDCYARGGSLKKAFESYSQAFRLGAVRPNLDHLVTGLLEMMSQKEEIVSAQNHQIKDDMFSCAMCRSMWNEPVNLRCGHTYCKGCLEKDDSKTCKVCKVSYKHLRISKMTPNVLLVQTAEKWFPRETKAVKLKSKGNTYFKEGKFKEAVKYYSEAFEYAPEDHLLASNRSYAYVALGLHENALKDAELCIKLRPDWSKGYFRKGAALAGLGRNEEAAFAYLQCLTLDQGVTSARNELAKSLNKMLCPLTSADDVTQTKMGRHAYGMFPQTAMSMFHNSRGLPSMHFDSIGDLKTSVEESLKKNESKSSNSDEATCPSQETTALPELAENFAHLSHTRSTSLPGSSTSSPLLPLRFESDPKRSSSTADLSPEHSVSRKRSFASEQREPMSPTRSIPNKQARSTIINSSCVSQTHVDFVGCKKNKRNVPPELLNKDDLECSLCFRLLYLPVTTPCGHSFCRQCLDRVMDHSPQCPLCKGSLVEYLADRQTNVTDALEQILNKYFPEAVAERKLQYEEEMAEFAKIESESQREIPIFVCTLAFPQLPCPLHVFEPRYRLMIRQCMESGTRQFGMCMHMNNGDEYNYCDYGVMLEVRDVQYFPDGRSVVDCMGGRRFKVVSRGTRDGYNTAKVEFLKDQAVTNPQELQELKELHNQMHSEASSWFLSIPAMPRAQITRHFGAFPEMEHQPLSTPNGPTWHWWLCAVLPLDQRAQLAILAMTSLKDRLKALHRVLNFVKRKNPMQ